MKKISDLIKVDQLSKNSFFELSLKDNFKKTVKSYLGLDIKTSDLSIKDRVILIRTNSKVKLRILLNKDKLMKDLGNLIRDIK